MVRRVHIALGLIAFTALGALAYFLLANTQIDLTGSGEAEGIVVATDFPNARCRKHIGRTFPYLSFDCEEVSPAQDPAPTGP